MFIGKNVVELDSVDSTNNYSTELVQNNNAFEGTVVVSNQQISGRGQRGNQWESDPFKNLTFSTIVYPRFISVQERFLLTKVASLAVTDFLLSLQLISPDKIKIKWPNDIYVGDKKIAGILIETTLSGSAITAAIIGIGLNVNQDVFKSAVNPTSLKLETGKTFSLKEILNDFCFFLEGRYLQLKALNFTSIHQDYLDRLYLLNRESFFLIKGKKEAAVINGVTTDGKLILYSRKNRIEADLKEVTFLF